MDKDKGFSFNTQGPPKKRKISIIETDREGLRAKGFLWRIGELDPHNSERNKELLENFRKGNNVESLVGLVNRVPQQTLESKIRWLVTHGLALDIFFDRRESHKDLDVVITDDSALNDFKQDSWGQHADIKNSWVGMSLDSDYLAAHAWHAQVAIRGIHCEVLMVHPGIILVEKLSDAGMAPIAQAIPREKDLRDAEEIVRFWNESHNSDPSWLGVIQTSLNALPENKRASSRERLSKFQINV